MNVKPDIENLLKRFRSEPSLRVKRAVLAKYAERRGHAKGAAEAAPFWRRSVPLYSAAVLIVFVAGLSFVGGLTLSRPAGSPEESTLAAKDTLPDAASELQWYYAPSDIF
jgi:hypothetical protein